MSSNVEETQQQRISDTVSQTVAVTADSRMSH
jgi:hypothetical protein